MYYSVGDVALDGTKKAADGTFVIDLDNVVESVTPQTMKDYTWTIKFTDTRNDAKELVVKDVKLLDTKNNVTFDSNMTGEMVINGGSEIITIK